MPRSAKAGAYFGLSRSDFVEGPDRPVVVLLEMKHDAAVEERQGVLRVESEGLVAVLQAPRRSPAGRGGRRCG